MVELIVALGILGVLFPGLSILFAAGLNLSSHALRETDQLLLTNQIQHWLADPDQLVNPHQKTAILLFDDACRLLPSSAPSPAWKAELRVLPGLGWDSPRLQCLHVRFLTAASGREIGTTLLQRVIPVP